MIGLGLGFRVFIVTFRAGFDGLFFISLALTVAEAIVDFDRSGSMLISSWNLTGHHDATGKKNKKSCQPVLKFTMCDAALHDWNHRYHPQLLVSRGAGAIRSAVWEYSFWSWDRISVGRQPQFCASAPPNLCGVKSAGMKYTIFN